MCLFFSQLWVQCTVCMTFAPQPLNMCSKLPTTFTLFPVLNLQVSPRTIMVSLPLTLFMGEKIPGSPHLHNFNVRILEGEAWEQGYNACLVLVRFRSGILGSCSKNSWLPQVGYESHYHTCISTTICGFLHV